MRSDGRVLRRVQPAGQKVPIAVSSLASILFLFLFLTFSAPECGQDHGAEGVGVLRPAALDHQLRHQLSVQRTHSSHAVVVR